MISPEIKKKILDDLNKLSVEKQRRVQEFTHALLISQPKSKSGKDILKLKGTLENEDALEIKNIIEEGCEQVDLNEW